MLNETSFEAFAQGIATTNKLPIKLARQYAARIGDTPELVSKNSDFVIVRDDAEREIARVRLPFDD